MEEVEGCKRETDPMSIEVRIGCCAGVTMVVVVAGVTVVVDGDGTRSESPDPDPEPSFGAQL